MDYGDGFWSDDGGGCEYEGQSVDDGGGDVVIDSWTVTWCARANFTYNVFVGCDQQI